jgi:hypothetical protein
MRHIIGPKGKDDILRTIGSETRSTFRFPAGQHLPTRVSSDTEVIRRDVKTGLTGSRRHPANPSSGFGIARTLYEGVTDETDSVVALEFHHEA